MEEIIWNSFIFLLFTEKIEVYKIIGTQFFKMKRNI